MYEEHGLMLLESELQEIIRVVREMEKIFDAARDVVASAEHIDGEAHKTLVCVDALTRLAAASNDSGSPAGRKDD